MINSLPTEISAAAGGFPFLGVKRARFQQFLVDAAEAEGIPIHWGKAVVDVTQLAAGVEVKFAGGSTNHAAFVVACDGLRSRVREVIFEESKATYTGLIQVYQSLLYPSYAETDLPMQTAGLCPTPDCFANLKALRNVFGPGAHFISIPISEKHMCFAFTTKESELRESWGAMSADDVADWKRDNPFASWGEGIAQCIASTDRVIKVRK